MSRCVFGELCHNSCDSSLQSLSGVLHFLSALSKASQLALPFRLELQNEETARLRFTKAFGADSREIFVSD